MEWIQFPNFNHLWMYGQLESLLLHFATFDVNLFLPPTVLYIDVARKMKRALVTTWVLSWIEMMEELPSHKHTVT